MAKKCAQKTKGDFVFDRRPNTIPDAAKLNGFSSIQSDILRLNAANQNVNSLAKQLKGLSATIQMFTKRSSNITGDIISAYHDRSLLLFHLQKFSECIADATFIIDNCPFYSNAYMIRSRAFIQLNCLHKAYDDILQACIFEKFAENEINAMLSIIVKKIGEKSESIWNFEYIYLPIAGHIFAAEISEGRNHGDESFKAYGKKYKFPASQWTETLHLWKSTNNYITAKFPQQFDDAETCGFRSAINALHRNEYSLIVPACEMEIMSNGEYVQESRLLRAQMHHLLLPFGAATKRLLTNDLDELQRILTAVQSRNYELVFETKLMICRIYFALNQYKKEPRNCNVYAIFADESVAERKGILHFWQGYDLCATYQSNELQQGLQLLRRSLKLMGKNFFVGHFFLNIFQLASHQNVSLSKPVEEYILRLGELHLVFPAEIQPMKLLINYYIQNKAYKVAAIYVQTLAKLSKQTSSKIDLSTAASKSELEIIIDYLKAIIRNDPEEYAAYDALIVIYSEQTFEYAKCLEVMAKGMAEICDHRLYRQLFQRRQQLLFAIAAANFWPEL